MNWIRPLGNTGHHVSAVGFGAMHFDGMDDEDAVGSLLNEAVNAGVTLIDTARGYGRSEERIGRHLSWRRNDFVLSTKFGYGVDGVADWTYDCIRLGVERALRVMRTDHIDIGHLHSCSLEVLQRGEVIQALADCVTAGKLRVAAYSGENAELAFALADHRIGSVQMSASLTDRANLQQLQSANYRGQGVLVKRSLAALSWTRTQRPDWDGAYCEGQYSDRWQAMKAAGLVDFELPWNEVAVRYAAYPFGNESPISSLLIGTKSVSNLKQCIEAVKRGPLPDDVRQSLIDVWSRAGGQQWLGIV
jgi:aryl-alcohol dehydrogenase-like predicted oxidoreductase